MSKKQMIIGTVMEDEKYGEGDVGHILNLLWRCN